MGPITELAPRVRDAVGEIANLSRLDLTYLHLQEAVLAGVMLTTIAVAMLVLRSIRGRRPGHRDVILPAVLPPGRRAGLSVGRRRLRSWTTAPARHVPFLLFLGGLGFFFVALAAPQTALIQEETTYPGHRITILIDASLSMDSAFATERLRAGNTFLANVAAAEYFVKRRMEGPYRDLVSLIQFGSRAYIVTPFTNDYENILLSIGLIGTPEEYDRFPDHGTLIMEAINRGVQLFRTFDFLRASGNLIIIFSDGQDTHAVYEGASLDDILQQASDNEIPVYFIRTSYDRELGDILPDITWKLAVERTGGKFFPAANETAILEAIEEVDRLSAGEIEVTRYVTQQPQFGPFALVAVASWTIAVVLALGVRACRRFP